MSHGVSSEPRPSLPTLKTGLALRHPAPLSGEPYSAVELLPDDRAALVLDQRRLPSEEHYEIVTDVETMAVAIRELRVRGAPALGVAAAYGLVLAARRVATADVEGFQRGVAAAADLLRATRPTAVNLAWALHRMAAKVPGAAALPPGERVAFLAAEARAIHTEDVEACRRIGAFGAEQIRQGATVLTHCNAGGLATGGFGTALGVLKAAHAMGKGVRVFACETRPLLQGARLTAWELAKAGIPVTVITDSMAASLFAAGRIDMVVVGADRVAKNGDVANKIGTYGLACLAHLHNVPFDVAAPMSTVDFACESGAAIPIEMRAEAEVLCVPGPPTVSGPTRVTPEGVAAFNPAFDVTPARYVRALYTERGVAQPLGEETLRGLA